MCGRLMAYTCIMCSIAYALNVVKVTECIKALEGGQVAFRMTTGCDHWSTVMQTSHDNLLS